MNILGLRQYDEALTAVIKVCMVLQRWQVEIQSITLVAGKKPAIAVKKNAVLYRQLRPEIVGLHAMHVDFEVLMQGVALRWQESRRDYERHQWTRSR